MKKKNVNKRIDNSNDLKFNSVNLWDFCWRDQCTGENGSC
jgi:hypothetical protein